MKKVLLLIFALLFGAVFDFAYSENVSEVEKAVKSESSEITGHIVLMGASILDNGNYVPPGEDVASHIRRMLPDGWKVTLLARDGTLLDEIKLQLSKLPNTATHIIFINGGNDALQYRDLMEQSISEGVSIANCLQQVNRWRREFLQKYHRVLSTVLETGLPVITSTIYDPQFHGETNQESAEAALCLFNDGITRTAFELGVDLIDLRNLLNQKSDLANPIEPSESGGAKLARVIVGLCTENIDPVSITRVCAEIPNKDL